MYGSTVSPGPFCLKNKGLRTKIEIYNKIFNENIV